MSLAINYRHLVFILWCKSKKITLVIEATVVGKP